MSSKGKYEERMQYAMWYLNAIYHAGLKSIKDVEKFVSENGIYLD